MIYVIHWFVNILTLGLVSIATITTTTYHVDEPITELNNKSLRYVFEDNNIYSYSNIAGASIQELENEYKITNITTYTRIINSNLDINDEYYLSFSTYIDEPITSLQIYRNSQNIILSYNLNDWTDIQYRWNNTSSQVWAPYYFDSGTLNSEFLLLKDALLINLDDLGVSNLSNTELDDWYDIYLQALANNGVYIESTSHLNNNIHLVDVSVMVISFGFWVWLFKFLKGVIF